VKKGRAPQEGDDDSSGVGYGKPPKQTRFRAGRSGNPKGRPKGTKNLKTDLIEELGEKILVREGERSRRVSKQRAMVKQLVAKTLKGDTRSASLLLSTMMRLVDTGEGLDPIDEPLLDEEREILAAFEARLRREADEVNAPISDPDTKPRDAS
jgi:Family of unknown function (DUF5681)